MATKRTRVTREPRPQITPELVQAWKEKDYSAVSRLLKLKPWECSPVWCTDLWEGKYGPCSDEAHRGCHRAVEIRDALNAALEDAMRADNV